MFCINYELHDGFVINLHTQVDVSFRAYAMRNKKKKKIHHGAKTPHAVAISQTQHRDGRGRQTPQIAIGGTLQIASRQI